jgi:hypothetical protein
MNEIGSSIGLLLVLGWLGICVWSWLTPSPKSTTSAGDAEHDRQIGHIIGMLGGSIEEAAQARYTISRLEEDLGRRATRHEMAIAVGVTLGS